MAKKTKATTKKKKKTKARSNKAGTTKKRATKAKKKTTSKAKPRSTARKTSTRRVATKRPGSKKKTTAKKKTAGKKKTSAKKKTSGQKTTAKKKTATKKKTASRSKASAKKSLAPTGLSAGSMAPPFSMATDQGTFDLTSYKGKKHVVLYFYPKDDTPGCTIEACTFQADQSAYDHLNAVVVGVSTDSAASHAKFRTKYGLGFPLIVDEGAKLARRYGVWVEKNMYGRKSMGVQRATFLIDKSGKIARVWPKVKVEGHSDEVLAALRDLN